MKGLGARTSLARVRGKLGGFLLGVAAGGLLWFFVASSLSVNVSAQRIGAGGDRTRAYLALFQDVFLQLRREYIDAEKTEPRRLIYGAIKGMLASLEDPYTVFFDVEAYKRFSQGVQGQYHGIGIYIAEEAGVLKLVSLVEGAPAWESGLRVGDIITHVNGVAAHTRSLDEISALILGEVGTVVKLKVERRQRQAAPQTLSFNLRRERVVIKSVYYSILPVAKFAVPAQADNSGDNSGSVAYIRIHRFALNTATEFKEALAAAKQAHVRGVVLDLRNNPGGFLTAAVEMVDFFVVTGVIVSTRDRERTTAYEQATRQLNFPKYVPVAVVVNKYSASASEIFAGALIDYGRAVSIGESTYGKFSVQREFPYTVPERVGIKMTIARYHLPSGEAYEQQGIPVALAVKNPENFQLLHTLKASYVPEDAQLQAALKLVVDDKRYRQYLKAPVAAAR